MNKTPQGLRNGMLAVAAMFGRFGAIKDNSPETFDAGQHIEGSGPGKRSSRHHIVKPKPRKYRDLAGGNSPAVIQATDKTRLYTFLCYAGMGRGSGNKGQDQD